MTTILTTRTAHWDICRHRRFERNDRQIKTAGGTELQGQLHKGTGNFAFDPQYLEPASLNTIAGTYQGTNPSDSYKVDSSGKLSGFFANCSLDGQILVRNNSKNIYDLNLSLCDKNYAGAATYVVMPGATKKSLVLIGMNISNNYYSWVTAAGERQ
jgi:hypothetical protein